MISARTTVEVVTRIYTAAGRRSTETEIAVYTEVLDVACRSRLNGLEAATVVEASRRMVARETWDRRPPSPALLLEYLDVVEAEARARRPAIAPDATGPVATPEQARQWMARLSRRRGGEPEPLGQSLPSRPTPDAHSFGDHTLCGGPGCDASTTVAAEL
ncbi:MAG: hypothetical protein ABR540_10760 [Acidimicrobiales bacterium]